MKFLVAFAVVLAVASADVSHVVQSAEAAASVVRSEADVKPDGFQYAFETTNGIAASAHGDIKDANTDHASQTVVGEFTYISPEGQHIATSYVADENGYQPKGEHLPVAPEIPAAIVRSLEWIAAHPQIEQQQKYVAPVAPAQPFKSAPSGFAKQYGKF